MSCEADTAFKLRPASAVTGCMTTRDLTAHDLTTQNTTVDTILLKKKIYNPAGCHTHRHRVFTLYTGSY